jgi:RNA polymerase-binding transcription factor DksA
MADMGTDMQEREITSIFAHRESKYLAEIDNALESIEKGTYGVCEICKDLIEPERLEAVPIAKYHVSCKETSNQRKNNR